jgi:hypothetical protein
VWFGVDGKKAFLAAENLHFVRNTKAIHLFQSLVT